MPKKIFTKEYLFATLYEYNDENRGIVIKNELCDAGRWSLHYDFIFKCGDDRLWSAPYSVGATESQDEGPWENDGDEMECIEVEAYEKTIIDYRPIGDK